MNIISSNEEISVCAYCRVSTEKESQLNSLDNQTYYFEEFINKNSKYKMYQIYADEGLSATSWKKRMRFQEMLYDAGLDMKIYRNEIKAYVSDRSPKFSRIMIKDVSRFSRNASEGLELITKLREKGVHVDFVSLGLSSEQMTNDMIIGFFLLAAENESKDKSKKIQWGKRVGAERGVINTSDNFYGYKYYQQTNSLEVIENEADVIKLIYKLYTEQKMGYRAIVKFLAENNIRSRNNKMFIESVVKKILTHHRYTGLLVRNKLDSPKVFTSKVSATVKPIEEWIIIENRIPQIIEPEVFQMAQDIRESKLNHKKRVGINNGQSKYSGLLICANCNANYVKNKDRYGEDFYVCNTKKKKGKSECDSPYVYLNQIDETLEKLAEVDFYQYFIKERDDHINLFNNEIKRLESTMDKQDVVEVERISNELNELYEENKRLGILFVKGTIKEEVLNELQSDLDQQIEVKKKELQEKSMSNDSIKNRIDELSSVIETYKNIPVKKVYTVKEVLEQIETILVHQDPEDVVRKRSAILEPTLGIFKELSEINKRAIVHSWVM